MDWRGHSQLLGYYSIRQNVPFHYDTNKMVVVKYECVAVFRELKTSWRHMIGWRDKLYVTSAKGLRHGKNIEHSNLPNLLWWCCTRNIISIIWLFVSMDDGSEWCNQCFCGCGHSMCYFDIPYRSLKKVTNPCCFLGFDDRRCPESGRRSVVVVVLARQCSSKFAYLRLTRCAVGAEFLKDKNTHMAWFEPASFGFWIQFEAKEILLYEYYPMAYPY